MYSYYSTSSGAESRRDQEEGGELDSHEEVRPEEIKSRKVVLGWRERIGLLLLQLFSSGGAMDIVFAILFCIAVGTAIVWTLPNEHPVVPAAVHGSLGLPGWRLFRGLTLLSPFSPLVPVPDRPSVPLFPTRPRP